MSGIGPRCCMCYLPKATDPFDTANLPVPVCFGCRRNIQAVVGWLDAMGATVTPPSPQESRERDEKKGG